MQPCVLPQTGVDEPWMLVAIIAGVLVVAGIVVATSARARRGVLTGLGALAIVGALLVGGMGAAAPAQADAAGTGCVAAPAPVVAVDAATVVTPGIPTATAQCFAEPTVQIPSTEGVVYAQSRSGSTLTVTATAAPGFALLAGTATSWTFDLDERRAVPESPVDLPERTAASPREGTPWFGGAYLQPIDVELIPSLQAAEAAGLVTYALDASEWRIELDVVAFAAGTDEELGRRTVTAPIPSELSYDEERGQYLLVSDAFDFLAIEQAIADAEAELRAAFPESSVGIDLSGGETGIYQGLEIEVAYDGGADCGAVTTIVPIDLVFGEPVEGRRIAPSPSWLGELLASLSAPAAAADAVAADAPAAPSDATDVAATPAAPEAPEVSATPEAPEAPEADAAPVSEETVVDESTPAAER